MVKYFGNIRKLVPLILPARGCRPGRRGQQNLSGGWQRRFLFPGPTLGPGLCRFRRGGRPCWGGDSTLALTISIIMNCLAMARFEWIHWEIKKENSAVDESERGEVEMSGEVSMVRSRSKTFRIENPVWDSKASKADRRREEGDKKRADFSSTANRSTKKKSVIKIEPVRGGLGVKTLRSKFEGGAGGARGGAG